MKTRILWMAGLFVLLLMTGYVILFKGMGRPIRHSVTEIVEQVPRVQPEPSPTPLAEPVTVLFAGDMMFDRHIRQNIERRGADWILGEMYTFLNEFDLVVANLEGPITTNPSISTNSKPGEPKNFIFTFDPGITPLLQKANIQVVNLGNNHIHNQGKAGVTSTKDYLEAANIEYFGWIGEDENRFLIRDVSGLKLGFVNYNQFQTGGEEKTMEDIATATEIADVVVVVTHWGNEYQQDLNPVLQSLAHDWIESGADAVIGMHQHVIATQEVYKGKTIYYGLGNFVFDQYFQPEVMEGLLVEMKIDTLTKELTFVDHKVKLERDGRTVLRTPH